MSAAARTGDNEVTILARVFDDEHGLLPRELARAIVDVDFSERDKARMHDLAVHNQADTLSPSEKEELYGFAKAGTLLSILQSKARRTLKIKPKNAPSPEMQMNVALFPLVWRPAKDRCEYCQMPHQFDRTPFEIDHIISEKHKGPTVAGNLC